MSKESLSPQELELCLKTLKKLEAIDPNSAQFLQVEQAAAHLRKHAKKKRQKARRAAARQQDQQLLDQAQMAQEHLINAGEEPSPATITINEQLNSARNCYTCKAKYRKVDSFYHALCPDCAELSKQKRNQRIDLTNRRALITGARIKIGFQLALKLLRDGAQVAITTRFPNDAWQRFQEEKDSSDWIDRLEIHALDFKNLSNLMKWIETQQKNWDHLDIIVNNAAQTVRRPPAYYSEWAKKELSSNYSNSIISSQENCLNFFYQKCLQSISEDGQYFPKLLDEEHLPLDLRTSNSWHIEMQDVAPIELLEVIIVNTIAPFLITHGFIELLRKSPFKDKFVVQASAVEGQFAYPNKTSRHPHTNMAKAALNMLTRTSGPTLAQESIYLTSVDTGWVTNENPQHQRQSMRQSGFRPPLDVIEGAARLYDPIIRGLQGEQLYGVFLKDYQVAPW